MTDTIGPIVHDALTLYSGDTWQLQFTITEIDGSPLVIDGGTQLIWKLNDNARTNNWITRSIGNGIVVEDGPAGICLVEVDSEQTAKLIIAANPYADELTVIKGTTSTNKPRIITVAIGSITVAKKAK